MLWPSFRICRHLLEACLRPVRRHQIADHILRLILIAQCLLHRGTTPQIEFSRGQCSGAARCRCSLKDNDRGTVICSFDGRACAGTTEAHDGHITVTVPVRNACFQQRLKCHWVTPFGIVEGDIKRIPAVMQPSFGRLQDNLSPYVCYHDRHAPLQFTP